MTSAESKILTRAAMVAERARLRAAGRKLVFTNGAFDILHAGHVTYLGFARNQGDALCVGLNSDASVKRYKGDLRPVNPQADRALVLAALACVDYVVVFDEDEPKDLIGAILPDVLVKGADWAHYVSGRDIVEAHGGKVVLAQMVEGRSTTKVIERIVAVYGAGSKSNASSSPPSSSNVTYSADHEKLDVYRVADDFNAWLAHHADDLNKSGVAGLAELRDQLGRAAVSMQLNLAEGNSQRPSRSRARFFEIARGSAAECSACLDVLVSRQVLQASAVQDAKNKLARVLAMTTKLAAQNSAVV